MSSAVRGMATMAARWGRTPEHLVELIKNPDMEGTATYFDVADAHLEDSSLCLYVEHTSKFFLPEAGWFSDRRVIVLVGGSKPFTHYIKMAGRPATLPEHSTESVILRIGLGDLLNEDVHVCTRTATGKERHVLTVKKVVDLSARILNHATEQSLSAQKALAQAIFSDKFKADPYLFVLKNLITDDMYDSSLLCIIKQLPEFAEKLKEIPYMLEACYISSNMTRRLLEEVKLNPERFQPHWEKAMVLVKEALQKDNVHKARETIRNCLASFLQV